MRKKPKQERAKETVRIIVAAATQILHKEGLDGLTTNRVAKTAGVSIGSVYQYFPNKNAILSAVADQQRDLLEQNLQQLLKASEGVPTEQLIPAMIRGMFALRSQHHMLHTLAGRSLELPGALDRRLDLAERMRAMVRRLLQRRAAELRTLDPDLASFVIVHTILGAVNAIDRGVEPWFTGPDELVDELTLLMRRYLAPDAPSPAEAEADPWLSR